MASTSYDVIVVGLGAMGSAAAYHLAKRGRRVLGLDAYARGHTNGSSHGRSRGFRLAYGESPKYVPLIQHAYDLWRELEAESGRSLLTITGRVRIGPDSPNFDAGAKRSAAQYGLTLEELTPAEVMARFPGFRVPDGYRGVYDQYTGILAPEPCVAAHLDCAARHGATLRHDEPVRRWAADGAGVRVETDGATYLAGALVIAAGPWAGELLAGLGLPLTPWRMYNVYFAPTRPELFGSDRCPVFSISVPYGSYYGVPHGVPEGSYYGVPLLPGEGLKLGRNDAGEVCTPATARRSVTPAEIAAYRAVLDQFMPGASGEVVEATTCLYMMTPDRHFVIDRHPEYAQVAYFCGCSGHAFKFAATIGEVLADLATDGATRHPVDFFAASRFAAAPA